MTRPAEALQTHLETSGPRASHIWHSCCATLYRTRHDLSCSCTCSDLALQGRGKFQAAHSCHSNALKCAFTRRVYRRRIQHMKAGQACR